MMQSNRKCISGNRDIEVQPGAGLQGPLVSIIIPVFNAESSITRCMNSVQAQSLQALEIIIVDDGSTDRTPEILRRASEQDSRIIVIRERNGGAARARNVGLAHACGKYIGFVDSDDVVKPDMFETLLCTAENKGLDICYSGAELVRGGVITKTPHPYKGRVLNKGAEIDEFRRRMYGPLPDVHDEVPMSVWRSIYRADLIQKACAEFPQVPNYEDACFNIAVLRRADSIAAVDYIGYEYHINLESWKPEEVNLRVVCGLERSIDILKKHAIQEDISCQDEALLRISTMALASCRSLVSSVANSNIPKREKIEKIESILCSDLAINALRDYPYQRLPKWQRMHYHAMKKGDVTALLLHSKINRAMKSLLHP